jgi:hypothetical protein
MPAAPDAGGFALVVEDMHTSGTVQTRHKMHTRLRHLTTGRLIDRVLQAKTKRVLGDL